MRVDVEHVLLVPGHIVGAPGLGADIVLGQDAAGGEDQGEGAVGALRRRHELGDHEAALAAHEAADMHEGRSLRCLVVARPLHGAQRVELGEGDAGEGRRQLRDLVHDLGGIIVVHRIAHGGREFGHHLPFLLALQRRLDHAHAVDAALGVGEGAILLEEGGAGQEHVGEGRGLVQEQVLHDNAFHRLERVVDVLGVGVRLGNVLALHEQALVGALDGGIEHVGNAQARLGVECGLPHGLEHLAHRVVTDVAVAREFVREGTHVAGALNIVLPTEGIHTHAVAAHVARQHGEVGHAHDHGGTLAVLGDAEAIVDGAIATRGKEAGRSADFSGGNAGDFFQCFRRIAILADEGLPAGELDGVAALGDVVTLFQALGEDHVGERVDHGDVGAGAELQVMRGFHMRRFDEIDPARIGDDELGAVADRLLHARAEHRVGVRRVGADEQQHVGLIDGLEVLRAGRGAEGARQAITRRRVADAGTGVDVVVLEGGADHFLHHEDFLVGASRRGDAADRGAAIRLLDRLEALRGVANRLGPGHGAPRIGDLVTDHRGGDAVLVGGVAPGEAALHAGMALVGAAVLVRHHADDFVALHLSLEGAADAAIGAGGDDGMFRLAHLDH